MSSELSAAGFTYSQRTLRVVFGDGALARLGEELSLLGTARALLVTTPGRRATASGVQEALGPSIVATFEGSRPHVPATVVAEALACVTEANPDCVLALGGGSAIGLGKAIVRQAALPLIALPTTYSGSEMTEIWGITDGARKETGRDPRVAPRLVVYDPALTATLPPGVAGPSGMNAMAHAVEALYSRTASPLSSWLAGEGIGALAESLPAIVSDPGGAEAHRRALWGAHCCGRALDLTTMGLHHKLCHVLGGTLGTPHALTHAILLPHVTAANAAAAPEAMATIAASLGEPEAAGALWRLNARLGIHQTLADLGVGEGDIDRIAERITGQSFPNPAPVTKGTVRRILEPALVGEPPAPHEP